MDFRLVLDRLGDAVVAADASDTVVYANAAVERLLGWEPGELVGQPTTVLMPARMHEAHERGFRRFVTTHVARLIGRPVRVPARRKDGSELEIELTLSNIPGDGGELFIAAMRDLRDRVELERQLGVSGYLRAAVAAAARLTGLLDADRLVNAAVDELEHGFHAALARIWLVEEERDTLVLRASAGVTREIATSSRARIDIATYPYKVGVVARTRRPVVANGLAGDPDFDQEWVAREGLAAVAAFPLLVGDDLRGVLVAFFRNALHPEVFEVLQTFAALVTAALNDATLFAREQRALAAQAAIADRLRFLVEAGAELGASLDVEETLRRVVAKAVPWLGDYCVVDLLDERGELGDPVAVAHVDPARTELVRELRRRYPARKDAPVGPFAVIRSGRSQVGVVDDALLRAAARDEEHLRIARELGLSAYMILPLAAGDRVRGAMTFVRTGERARFGDDDLRYAEELARRAASAIENAFLYRRARDAVRARDEFLSVASHELRTPLTPLRLQMETLQRAVAADQLAGLGREKLAARISVAIRQIERLAKLVDTLLDVSRLRVGRVSLELDDVDARALADDVAARLRDEALLVGSSITVGGDAHVLGRWDRLKLDQVVTNLVSNAIKYGAGKPITIEVRRDGHQARIEVADQGIGIPADDLRRIFGQFERAVSARSYGGLGLGLFIVRELVEAHGGSVSVASTLGSGSRFTVMLPLSPAPTARPCPEAEPD